MKQSTEYYTDVLNQKQKKRREIFSQIPDSKKIAVFLNLRKKTKYQILQGLPEQEVINFLEALDPDDATDVLRFFEKSKRNNLLKKLSRNIQDELVELLKFDEKTAGGLMNLNYIQMDEKNTVGQTLEKFKIHEKRTGKPPEIVVVSEGKVVGYVPGYKLGFASIGDNIGNFKKQIKIIHYSESDREVIEHFKNNPHNKLFVLDDHKNVIGVIYSDDVLKVLKEQSGISLYNFAGIDREEEATDPAKLKIKFRYRWLMINLITAFIAAFTVGLFKETLDKYVLLAVYMPVVAGMGGNAATQTLAVMVRGIALKQITFGNFLYPLLAEIKAGFVNGIINGALVFFVVMFVNQQIMIALILSVAMVINLIVASFFGTVIPLVMKRLDKDPAASATIFITTATDVFGFLAFLGLATLLLR